MHHRVIKCYKRYCLSKWWHWNCIDYSTVIRHRSHIAIQRDVPSGIYQPWKWKISYKWTFQWEKTFWLMNEDFLHWHVRLPKGYWCMRICSAMVCSCRGVYLQRAGKFHGALCYQSEPQILKRSAKQMWWCRFNQPLGTMTPPTVRVDWGCINHQQPRLPRFMNHLLFAGWSCCWWWYRWSWWSWSGSFWSYFHSSSTPCLVEDNEKWHDFPIYSK